MQSDIVIDFLNLVQIDAASLDERGVADYLIKALGALGCKDITEDKPKNMQGNTGNIIARFPGKLNGSLLLSAHMDRVQGGRGIKPIVGTQTIKSDGNSILAADDVAGLVAILDGVRRLKESGIEHSTIEIVFTYAEEQQLLGSSNLDYSKLKSDYAFVFDSSGPLGRIINSAPSTAQLFLKVHGKSAHAGVEPEKGINATVVAAKILANIIDGRIDDETTSNFGVFRTGSNQTNIVCDYAEVAGEVRSLSDKKLEKYLQYFEKYCLTIAEENKAVAEVSYFVPYRSFKVSPDHEIISIAKSAMKKISVNSYVESNGGGLDANNFTANDIVSIGFGMGYYLNHTNEEYIEIKDLIKSGELVYSLVQEYSKLRDS